MSDVFSLPAQSRDPAKNKGTGSRVARRLRAAGQIPAIVYGHKQAPQPVSIARDDVWRLIKKSAHLANLSVAGAAPQTVLVRDIQWDHLGKEIIHLDFARVDASEQVEAEVRLELHGSPAGVAEGGVLEFLVHTLPVSCRADSIPDLIRIEIADLKIGDGVHVRDLTLPAGVKAEAEPELLLVHVVTRAAEVEETPAEAGPAEPEVIGRKAEDKDKDKED
jgi:large subunit ribosomal protein L25